MCENNALFYIIVIYYHFNIPTVGPFRWADTHIINYNLLSYCMNYNYHIGLGPLWGRGFCALRGMELGPLAERGKGAGAYGEGG